LVQDRGYGRALATLGGPKPGFPCPSGVTLTKFLVSTPEMLRFGMGHPIMVAMWLAVRYGFFSLACAQNKDGTIDTETMMIRARSVAHLRNLQKRFESLAGLPVKTTQHTDYRYRLIVSKEVCASVVTELVREQTWSNFKQEAARFGGINGRAYSLALHDVWEIMNRLQGRE
jgi:hypothetical protein